MRGSMLLLAMLVCTPAWACEEGQERIFSCQADGAVVEMCQSDLAMHLSLHTAASPLALRVPLSELRWEFDGGSGMQMNRFTFPQPPFAYRLTVDETFTRAYGDEPVQPGARAAWLEVLLMQGGLAETGRYTCNAPIQFENTRIHATAGGWREDPSP